jgi:hypothetical protein
MDDVLAKYRDGLKGRVEQDVPSFAPEAVHTAPILALLLEPDKSGAAGSRIVQVHNNDPTARRTLKMINRAKLRADQYVLWNFYASFEAKTKLRHFWEKETKLLIKEMPNLKVVLVFGTDAWIGMRDVELPRGVALIGAPHPSNRGVMLDKLLAEEKIERAWARAKQLIDVLGKMSR